MLFHDFRVGKQSRLKGARDPSWLCKRHDTVHRNVQPKGQLAWQAPTGPH